MKKFVCLAMLLSLGLFAGCENKKPAPAVTPAPADGGKMEPAKEDGKMEPAKEEGAAVPAGEPAPLDTPADPTAPGAPADEPKADDAK